MLLRVIWYFFRKKMIANFPFIRKRNVNCFLTVEVRKDLKERVAFANHPTQMNGCYIYGTTEIFKSYF